MLTLAFGLIATPSAAAIDTAYAPPRPVAVKAIDAADKAMVENHDQELPLECRGYYVRPHKTLSTNRCN